MKHIKKLVCAGILVTLGFNAIADVIYDDFGRQYSSPPIVFSMGNGQEIGNEVSFTPGWTLTNFSIEYFTPNTTAQLQSANVGIDVRFYNNNGAVTNGFPSPGSPFYDSGWFFGLLGGATPGYQVVTYNSSDFSSGVIPLTGTLPSGLVGFTFTITFTNLGVGGTSISLPLATNTPGISFGDYWTHEGAGIWTLRSTNVADANFVVDFAGTPEPSSLALAALGGAVLLGVNKLRRKR